MRCCLQENAILGPGTGRWPGLNAWFLPLQHDHHPLGSVCIHHVQARDEVGKEHAQALCALLAQSLWRLKLTADVQASQAQAHRQELQNTFLAAVSHDLRTPLATIIGAASALQTQRDKLTPTAQQGLIDGILREAGYLAKVTDNTLQLVRLNNSQQPPMHQWESLEEIVGTVLRRVRQRDTTLRIRTQMPDDLPLLQVDPVLIAQLIENLLENALKYSEGCIDLQVNTQNTTVQISVKDIGPTISPSQANDIFQPYMRGDQSGPHGAGLGLALCLSIAHYHHGNLTLHSRPQGGNHFCLTLPLQEQPIFPENHQESCHDIAPSGG
jgi:two-component system sensor histidine kinase KdpD